jgi:O-antigen/teichoic acid export membrane protein
VNKYKRLGKNTFLVFIGSAGSKLIGIIMLPFYTRWLSVEDFGITDIIGVYVSFCLGIVTCCIADSIFIFPKGQDVVRQREYFSSGLFFSMIALLLTAILFFFIYTYSKNTGISNSFTDNIWLIYFMLGATFLQQYAQQFTRSIDKMKVYSTTGILLTGATALFSFILIPRLGVRGFVLAMIVANIFAGIYSIYFSRAYRFVSVKHVKVDSCKEMLKYSIPLIPNGIMWWLVGGLNRPVMESYLGMGAIGIFAVANKFPGILSMLFTVFGTSWQISVIEEFRKEGYQKFFNNIFRIVITGSIFFSCIMAVCSKLIVKVFTTENFYESWIYVPILTFAFVFSAISGLAGTNFSATKESKYYFYSSAWGAIAAVVSNFLLIPVYGIMGASIAVVISYFLMAIARVMFAWKYVRIENMSLYVTMLCFNVGVIIVLLNVDGILIKSVILAIVLGVLIGLNYKLKQNFNFIITKIKNRL